MREIASAFWGVAVNFGLPFAARRCVASILFFDRAARWSGHGATWLEVTAERGLGRQCI